MAGSLHTLDTRTIKLYLRYWKRYPWLTFACTIFSFTWALQAVLVPLLIAVTLGQFINQHTINTGLVVITVVSQVVISVASYYTDLCITKLHMKVEKQLYADCFEYLLYQDYAFFANRFSGSIVTQASRFVKAYTVFDDTMFFNLLPQLFTVFIAIGIMAWYSPLLAVLVFVIWLVIDYVIVMFALRRLPMRRAAVAKESEQVGELADVMANSLAVKTFASENREINRYGLISSLRSNLYTQSWNRQVRNVFVIQLVCVSLQAVVFVGGLVAMKNGTLSVATFLLFQVYAFRIIDSIGRSSLIVRQLEAVSGDGEEMAQLLQTVPPQVQDDHAAVPAKIDKGAIEFRSMDFQYADGNQNELLFENFTLHIKAGERVGLVGPSGGGKTTITRLLLRFMDIQGGSIVIDGHHIAKLKQQDLRSAMAYVPQEPVLFHRSIKENISYGKPGATEAEVIAVAKKSFAHDFIKDLPKGYDTMVGERGVKLSGGQRQRIAIARAMLKNAPILILDEATSALDSESERVIQKALWQLMKGKTAVVIAHRLSTIQRLDRIVVLDKGKIVEEGSHKKLLEQKGLYERLWKHQSGGFLEEE